MQHVHVFVLGLVSIIAAAVWYDDHVERSRVTPMPAQVAAGLAAR